VTKTYQINTSLNKTAKLDREVNQWLRKRAAGAEAFFLPLTIVETKPGTAQQMNAILEDLSAHLKELRIAGTVVMMILTENFANQITHTVIFVQNVTFL
jgi:hypothetical protein